MRVYVTAAAERAAVVQEDDLLTRADIQANPVKVPKALYTELKTRFDDKCFNLPDLSAASSRKKRARWNAALECARYFGVFRDREAFDAETLSGTARVKSATTRQRGGVQEA
eukprot:6744360-Pyramimonas_sp.AAC.1